jgi:glycosyltransferase involved in cell wall biosynthesis
MRETLLPQPTIEISNEGAHDRLRVALFSNSVFQGGLETHVELIAQYLDRSRFEVFAITPRWQKTRAFSAKLAQLADHHSRIAPDRRHGILLQIFETWRLYHQLREWQIDVLHMHSTSYRGQLIATYAARLAGVKAIYRTEHLAPDHRLPIWEQLSHKLLKPEVDGVICVSQKNYQARKTYIDPSASKMMVVNNGVDLSGFPPIGPELTSQIREHYAIPDEAAVIGCVVRFEAEKGLEYLIDAMPKIRGVCPNSVLLLVGDGTLRPNLEAQVAELGLEEWVRFTGFQSDPRPFIASMDVFVLPVPVGSMSIGLLEAMAMERAVVMSFGGEGEAVIHGETGFCATPRDSDSIAAYVIELLKQPELRKRLGRAARQRVESEFSAQRVAETLGKVYETGILKS